MKSFSALSLSSIALACSLFMACNEEEDLVPQMEPAKPMAQAPAPKAAEPAPAEKTAPVEKAVEADEPQLVPIQSLSASKDNAVKEEAPAAATAPIANGDGQLDKGDYVIQVSIQASKKAADAIVKKLAENNVKAYVASVENPGELEGTYYRIRVGYFASSADAQAYGKQTLSPLNYAWWVDKTKNDEVGNPGGESGSYSNSASYSNNNSSNGSWDDDEEVVETPAAKAEPAPAPAPAPKAEPAPAPAPAPAPKEEPAPAPKAEPAPAPAAPAADDYDDWE